MSWRAAGLLPLLLLAGCEPRHVPEPLLRFEGLPVRGSIADAKREGFPWCVTQTRTLRCRREGVMVMGQGPYTAAADLYHKDGSGGFDKLTLWHPYDQRAVSEVGKVLKAQGWQLCRTGPNERHGDQEIYRKAGAPVRFSIDLSYYGKRRIRLIPERGQPTGKCW